MIPVLRDGTVSFVTNPPAGTNIAPGTTVTILGSENSYYIL
jgi:hypothetical protein